MKLSKVRMSPNVFIWKERAIWKTIFLVTEYYDIALGFRRMQEIPSVTKQRFFYSKKVAKYKASHFPRLGENGIHTEIEMPNLDSKLSTPLDLKDTRF